MKIKNLFGLFLATGFICFSTLPLTACSTPIDETVVLKVASWEEYIDLGDWDESDVINIENDYLPNGIIGKNSMIDDYVKWFSSQNYGFEVKVEYSTFGTNEDLYNQLNLGDTYDLVCPSDYMLMKLIADGKAEKFSENFKDASIETNYYAKNVSPYIDCAENSIFVRYDWDEYAACYMWGTTGLVYNPDKLNDLSDVESWSILCNENYEKKITVKDNVRDAYFATLGILNSEELLGDITTERRSAILNDVNDETIAKAQEKLKDIKDNVYCFETDSGKSDMVTGKVVANYQWSGDAVFILNEAENDAKSVNLWYSVPNEVTNLWFDGWLMMKDSINGNANKKTAAEAFINFLSRPDNAVRNMEYIGYTSAITDQTVLNYMDWKYGVSSDFDGETYDYDLSCFFGSSAKITIDKNDVIFENDGSISKGRQLFAQYPTQSVIDRSVVMLDFGNKLSDINQMWINVRCLDLFDIPIGLIIGVVAAIVLIATSICLYVYRDYIFVPKAKRGYKKIN